MVIVGVLLGAAGTVSAAPRGAGDRVNRWATPDVTQLVRDTLPSRGQTGPSAPNVSRMSSNAGLLPRALVVGPHRWLRWPWLPVAFALVAIGLWWSVHLQALPTADRPASRSERAGVGTKWGS